MPLILMLIEKIGPISEERPVATLPTRIVIEVQTSGGPAALEMSPAAAAELAEALAKHLQARGSR